MGLGLFGGSSDSYPTPEPYPRPKFPNPNPENYVILDEWSCGHPHQEYYLVLKIRYPDCTNFEGEKILVYHNVTKTSLLTQKLIDPHFSNKTGYHSPIARFVPTSYGWEAAVKLCRIMLGPH